MEKMNFYLNEASKIPLLSAEEERELSEKIAEGSKEALKKLVSANLRYVIKVAAKFHGLGLEIDDLVQEGNAGLILAAEKYDGKKGYRFLTYAVWWIRQSIIRALYATGKPIKIPCHIKGGFRKMNLKFLSIENKMKDSEGMESTLGDYLTCEDLPSPEDETVNSTICSDIRKCVNSLKPQEKYIIGHRFGFFGKPETLQEIGDKINLSKERVRQIENKVLSTLRKEFKAKDLYPESA